MNQLVARATDCGDLGSVMPAKSLPPRRCGAGIQEDSARASGYFSWIPAFAGMTCPLSISQFHYC